MKNSRTIIAVDIGYGNTKAVYSRGLDRFGRIKWSEVCFRSITPEAIVDEESVGLGNTERVLIPYKGRNYYAGPAASSDVVARALEPDYIHTDQHEILLRAALHFGMRSLGRKFDRIDALVLGLPVSGFVGAREKLLEIGAQPREVPIPKSLIDRSGETSIVVKADHVIVRPQPYGSMMVVAETAQESDSILDPSRLTMVIDPGYRTFDWFVSAGLVPEMALSGSFDGGVSSIYRALSQRIGYDQGTGSLEFDQVEEGLRNGEIRLVHKKIDMKPYLEVAESLADRQVVTFLSRLDRNKSRISRVLLTGGGASLYEKSLRERMPGVDVELQPESLMANARGYWIAGCHWLDI